VVEEGRGCSDDGGAQSCPAPRLHWKQGAGGHVRLSVSREMRGSVVSLPKFECCSGRCGCPGASASVVNSVTESDCDDSAHKGDLRLARA
jgi:hypothetical protein